MLDNQTFFSCTSGRFLFNEQLRLKERRVDFDAAALHRAVEASVGHAHGKVVRVIKLAEGGFNRVFTLTLEDGFEIIAKIPYHISKPDRLATASEVATLAFLRSQGIPVPEVYAYSITTSNGIGTEYVLMDKATGICLSARWLDLNEKEMINLAHSFVELETRLFQLPFNATGSIYFKKDLDLIAPKLQAPLFTEGTQPQTDQFVIGPIADYMFWHGSRKGLDFQQGPWASPAEYLHSISQKEIEWTQRFGRSLEPDFPHNALDGFGIQQLQKYLRLLRDFQTLAPHLLPKDSAHSYNQPPRILAAGYPHAFENPDDELTPDITEPALPANFADMKTDEQTAERELFRQRMLFFGYRVLNGHLNQEHVACLRDPLLLGRQMLEDRAGRQWTGNIVTLKGAIVRMTQFWKHLPDVENVKCPVEFSAAELEEFADQEDGWLKMSVLVEQWRARACGMTEDGCVRTQHYEEAKKQLSRIREEMIEQCDGDEEDLQALERGWPFRDRDEES